MVAVVSLKSHSYQVRHGVTYPILNRNNDEALVVGVDDLGHILAAVTQAIATSVDPHQDGKVLGIGRGIYVQEEAVLVSGDEACTWDSGKALRANGPKVVGLVDGKPALDRGQAGGLPPQVFSWSRGIADSVLLGQKGLFGTTVCVVLTPSRCSVRTPHRNNPGTLHIQGGRPRRTGHRRSSRASWKPTEIPLQPGWHC